MTQTIKNTGLVRSEATLLLWVLVLMLSKAKQRFLIHEERSCGERSETAFVGSAATLIYFPSVWWRTK